jgi:hypothetical protein
MNQVSRPSVLCRIWPRRSDLMRPADWAEAAVRLAAIVVALLLVPVALSVGSETYAGQLRAGAEQARSRHHTEARLTQDAPPISAGVRGEAVSGLSYVPASWTLADGTGRTGKVLATNGTRAGEPVSVWLDGAGDPTTEPITHEQAALAGVAVAMGLWITSAAGICVLFLLVRTLLNRRRETSWQREWAQIEPDWRHRV